MLQQILRSTQYHFGCKGLITGGGGSLITGNNSVDDSAITHIYKIRIVHHLRIFEKRWY